MCNMQDLGLFNKGFSEVAFKVISKFLNINKAGRVNLFGEVEFAFIIYCETPCIMFYGKSIWMPTNYFGCYQFGLLN